MRNPCTGVPAVPKQCFGFSVPLPLPAALATVLQRGGERTAWQCCGIKGSHCHAVPSCISKFPLNLGSNGSQLNHHSCHYGKLSWWGFHPTLAAAVV